jgi:hypothetical protein
MAEKYEAPAVTSLGSVYEVTLGTCLGTGDMMVAGVEAGSPCLPQP